MMICDGPSKPKVHMHSDCSLPVASLVRPGDSGPRIPTVTSPVTTPCPGCLSWKGRNAFAALDCGLPCTFPLEVSLTTTRPLAQRELVQLSERNPGAPMPACDIGRPPNLQGPNSPLSRPVWSTELSLSLAPRRPLARPDGGDRRRQTPALNATARTDEDSASFPRFLCACIPHDPSCRPKRPRPLFTHPT